MQKICHKSGSDASRLLGTGEFSKKISSLSGVSGSCGFILVCIFCWPHYLGIGRSENRRRRREVDIFSDHVVVCAAEVRGRALFCTYIQNA